MNSDVDEAQATSPAFLKLWIVTQIRVAKA